VPSNESIVDGGSIHCVTQTIPALTRGVPFPGGVSAATAQKFSDMTLTWTPGAAEATPVQAPSIGRPTRSAALNQLKEQGMADKYPAMLEEMPRVRADLGYPPLVTPTSQITGSMAAFNVMFGRYKVVPREVKDLARGKYGRTPAPINPEVAALILQGEQIITHRPADDIAPQMEVLKKELAAQGYPNATVEDVLSYALFPDVALKFFESNRTKS